MDGITHWNHPGFMAYFNSTSSGPGILAELLTAAIGANGMLWKTSPAFTELEKSMMNWFRQMVGLPENYWGIIYDTASTSSMHAIASGREQLDLVIREMGMSGRADLPKLVMYCSEHSHNAIDKGALTLGIGLDGIRKISVNDKFEMIPEKLEEGGELLCDPKGPATIFIFKTIVEPHLGKLSFFKVMSGEVTAGMEKRRKHATSRYVALWLLETTA